MEYERIHKAQSGMISPSKLRMMLVGPHRKKEGSNANSSRTSPSKLGDSEFTMNSLLADDFTHEGVTQVNSGVAASDSGGGFRPHLPANSSSVHPVRTNDDDGLDYDSTSSFEFHKGERCLHHAAARSLARPISSKWNDAEKWIMSKPNASKRSNLLNQSKGALTSNMVRVAPESVGLPPSVKRVDFCEPPKFAFAGLDMTPSESKDLPEETTGVTAIRSVSMRDMGTEMTPIPSQEPSRSVTPVSSTSPLRSPASSMPSTPRRAELAPTSTDHPLKKELSEEEMKLKTRKEIVALGVQLGKKNIAAWASLEENERGVSGNEEEKENEQIENAKRASAWEEAEKTKHAARFKREEIRIQMWESQQKAKLEAEMRKIEAQIEQMRAHAQAKMMKKVTMARQKSEEKRSEAEARKSRLIETTVVQAEYIRQTGRIPSSSRFHCCGWLQGLRQEICTQK